MFMPNQHGGYRRPEKAAQFYGAGKASKRTDGKQGETMKQAKHYLAGEHYGDSKELNDVASGGDFAAGPNPNTTMFGMQDIEPVPFDAPTQRPDEPVTTGAPFGPGLGPLQPDTPTELDDDEISDILESAYAANPSIETLTVLRKWRSR